MVNPFHLALPTKNIKQTVAFYTKIIGCEIGRSDKTWVDFDMYGHQVVFHEYKEFEMPSIKNDVDNKKVHIPHYGIVLTMKDWEQLAVRLKQHKVNFIIEPYIRFKGTNGEQATLFFLDNNDYAIEMKAFENIKYLFEPFEKNTVKI